MPTLDDDPLKKYVRQDQPFGPADAADVIEPACAAALFDWNNKAFANLLDGSDVLVGRRGSGKSSLLRTFPAREFLSREFQSEEARQFRDRYRITSKILLRKPDFVIEVDTPTQVNELEKYCAREPIIPPVEVLASLWRRRIWWLLGKELERTDGVLWDRLPPRAREYLSHKDIVSILEGHAPGSGPMTVDEYVNTMEEFLARNDLKVIVTFDNVERHKFEPMQNAVLSGLIAATGKFIGAAHPSIEVKLCLPAELFGDLKKLAFRPDKDFHTVQYLHWTAAELLHLAARRLRIYLSNWEPEEYDRIRNKSLVQRQAVMDFWHRYFPSKITNSVGTTEDTLTYILRHTQMLPRQLIAILNMICKSARHHARPLFLEKFSDQDIREGIAKTEEPNTDAVLLMFRPLYSNIDDLFRAVMPRLRREFEYGYLQSVWQSRAKHYMEQINKPDFISFWRLMLATGAIGRKVEEQTSDVYSTALFEFNTEHQLIISDKDTLCVHPMFSRIYNLEPSESSKLILPRGSDAFETDDQS